MEVEKVTITDLNCGKLFMLRNIPKVVRTTRPVLRIMKEDMVMSRVEDLLKRMGLKIGLRGIIGTCHRLLSGTLVSVVLNAVPIAFAVLQDADIGQVTMIEIGNLVAGLIGDAIGVLVAGAVSGILVPLVIEVGGILGFEGITEVVAGTIVGAAIGGVGAIIGACVGALIAVGVHMLVSYIKKRDRPVVCRRQTFSGASLPLKNELAEQFLKSRFPHPDIKWEIRIPTKRELEGSPFLKQQHELPTSDQQENMFLKRQLNMFYKAQFQ
jgi:hypothetical protein